MVRRLWVSLGLLAFIGVSFTASTISVSPAHAAENDVIATVTVGADPYGVAVSPDGTRVYVANGLDDTVSVIDTSTNTVTDTVTVGTNPYGVAVSPDGSRVYVTNNGAVGGTVSVIDTSTNTVSDTITVGTNP
jgi:YVTN family beta-propeller protein